jgi:pilus assembly protein CpaF
VVETDDIFTTCSGKLIRAQGFPPHADRFARHGIDLVALLSGGVHGTPLSSEPLR